MQEPDFRTAVRTEMANVLGEMERGAAGPAVQQSGGSATVRLGVGAGRLGGNGAGSGVVTLGAGAGGATIDMFRERIAVLEDCLAKSEADRSTIYAKHEAAVVALGQANEEKIALMHELHAAAHNGPSAEMAQVVQQAREEATNVRSQMQVMATQYEQQIDSLHRKLREQETVVRKLRKGQVARESKVDGVSLADLHYSNERLSAQLSKIQTPAATSFDDAKFMACESAISALQAEVEHLEQRLQSMQAQHQGERLRWTEALERQDGDFALERAECDRVVGIMSAKLESMVGENNLLRQQLHQRQQPSQQLVAAQRGQRR